MLCSFQHNMFFYLTTRCHVSLHSFTSNFYRCQSFYALVYSICSNHIICASRCIRSLQIECVTEQRKIILIECEIYCYIANCTLNSMLLIKLVKRLKTTYKSVETGPAECRDCWNHCSLNYLFIQCRALIQSHIELMDRYVEV